jgi:hypothetical protein
MDDPLMRACLELRLTVEAYRHADPGRLAA